MTSTCKFVWCGQEKCEFRDATDAVTLRLYPQGQYAGTTAYFYTRDHLGSIREMFTGGGTVVARYDYDPYGRSTTVLGTTPTDFNFTGLYRHSKSNLDLAVYRAYDADLGRWLSRDPIGEKGGLNLYGYVGNDPMNGVDPLGLFDLNLLFGKTKPWGDKTQLTDTEFTVGGHGFPLYMLDSNGEQILATKLADLIKANPKYDPNKPVRLVSCNTGQQLDPNVPPFGQQLANALGSVVLAPTTGVILDDWGNTRLPGGGQYIPFYPVSGR